MEQAFKKLTTLLDNDELENLLNKLFLHLALAHNITSNPGNFCSLSIKAMELLKKNNKNNLVYKFALALCKTKPDTDEPVFPMDRMPFGLVEYQIEFFSCTHIRQVNAVVLMYNLDKKCIGSFPRKHPYLPHGRNWKLTPKPLWMSQYTYYYHKQCFRPSSFRTALWFYTCGSGSRPTLFCSADPIIFSMQLTVQPYFLWVVVGCLYGVPKWHLLPY